MPQIMYGFESTNEEILKNINKKVSASKAQDVIQWTRAARIEVRGAFMLGNHGETTQSMMSTIEYSVRAGIQFAIYNITTPYPGTPLYAWAQEQGYLMHRDWNLYDLSHPVLNLPTVTPDEIAECYRKAYRAFYMRPSFLIERLLAVRSWDYFLINLKAFLGIARTALPLGGNKK